jgi:hypothetical protein
MADALLSSRVLALQEAVLAQLLKRKGYAVDPALIRAALQNSSVKEAMKLLHRHVADNNVVPSASTTPEAPPPPLAPPEPAEPVLGPRVRSHTVTPPIDPSVGLFRRIAETAKSFWQGLRALI